MTPVRDRLRVLLPNDPNNYYRADIDEAAWSALYSTTSQSFAKPKTGKIAVKVIKHYGDKVLKVYSV